MNSSDSPKVRPSSRFLVLVCRNPKSMKAVLGTAKYTTTKAMARTGASPKKVAT